LVCVGDNNLSIYALILNGNESFKQGICCHEDKILATLRIGTEEECRNQ
jgi:hypothetical protein